MPPTPLNPAYQHTATHSVESVQSRPLLKHRDVLITLWTDSRAERVVNVQNLKLFAKAQVNIRTVA